MGALTATDRDAITRDGTRWEVERSGDGSPVALVCDQPGDCSSIAGVAAPVVADFAVVNDDCRDYGGRGNTPANPVVHEVEGFAAVFAVASRAACVFGV
jgi:hypothetical protein